MSEAVTTAPTAVAPAVPTIPLDLNGQQIVVDRNGVKKEYKLFKFLKGDSKGAEYPCPDVSDEGTFDETVQFLGKKVALGVFQNFLKAVHQKIRRDCTDEKSGIFDVQKAIRKYASFDVAGLTLKAISDKIDELQAINGKRVMEATAAQYQDEAWQNETKRITKEILDLMAEYDEKKSSGTKEEEVQPSVVS